jgi:hypothetical protein
MPSLDALTRDLYTPRDWLRYYRNIWTRNVVSYTIDVEYDTALNAKDPETPVPYNSSVGTVDIPVKDRLENRKEMLSHALATLAAIATLEALTNEELEARWSDQALQAATITVE